MASVRSIMKADKASAGLAIEVVAVAPGAATLSMKISANMMNGHGTCHGGFIFTLADTAFACACNSYNQVAVAQQNQITYLSPGREGMVLLAMATEVSRAGRSGIYDVSVSTEDGQAIAVFRGLSRTLKGQHFSEAKDDT